MDLQEGRITTVSGKQFYLANPRAEDIAITDVIYALSRICRYGGHLAMQHKDSIYSVLQHSVYVYWIVKKYRPEMAHAFMWALMHDATETWYGDIVSPLKRMFPEYRALEDTAAVQVRMAFNIPHDTEIEAVVGWADQVCWKIECVHVSSNPQALLEGETPVPFTMSDIDPDFYLWTPSEARARFIDALTEIHSGTMKVKLGSQCQLT